MIVCWATRSCGVASRNEARFRLITIAASNAAMPDNMEPFIDNGQMQAKFHTPHLLSHSKSSEEKMSRVKAHRARQ
jgi:hypothetical protein